MTVDELNALAAKINALSPPARLRLAANLMEAQKPETALLIAERVVGELRLALLLANRT